MTLSKLRRFYHQFSSDHQVLVLINADPDSLACAMAVKRLLWQKVAGVTLSNVNDIKRPDNLAMIRLLGIQLSSLNEIDPDRFQRVVIVDSQQDHHGAFARFHVDAVIDHHPDTSPSMAFKDIRPDYGSASTIMTEYLRAAKIKPSKKLATALFHAIKTDTSNFERPALIEDMRAFQFLFRHANIHLARKIEQAELRFDFLKYFKKALQDMTLRRGRLFIHLGTIPSADICVVIADFFMKVNSIRWSIVSGIHDRRLIVVLRNDGLRKNAGKIARMSFGELGSGGGHKSMARAEISIEDLQAHVEPADEKQVCQWIIRQIEKKGGAQ
ncbi:MAG: phosphoesterase [Desulfobacteraceae bacterium]|nr:MAG: phosphoesterase [Desulfobacteraceae bacterium]